MCVFRYIFYQVCRFTWPSLQSRHRTVPSQGFLLLYFYSYSHQLFPYLPEHWQMPNLFSISTVHLHKNVVYMESYSRTPFEIDFLLHSSVLLRSIQVIDFSVVHSFLLLGIIPRHECTTFCLTICLLKDMWVVFSLWLLWIKLYLYLRTSFLYQFLFLHSQECNCCAIWWLHVYFHEKPSYSFPEGLYCFIFPSTTYEWPRSGRSSVLLSAHWHKAREGKKLTPSFCLLDARWILTLYPNDRIGVGDESKW